MIGRDGSEIAPIPCRCWERTAILQRPRGTGFAGIGLLSLRDQAGTFPEMETGRVMAAAAD